MKRAILVWSALITAMVTPIVAAAMSPLLAWRDAIYITAGFAGIAALALLLVQPLVIAGYLPGINGLRKRRVHRWVGLVIASAVFLHIAGLWLTSPPDVVDALLFVSPTPFSAWGVIAMWAIIATAALALFRRRLRIRPRPWLKWHTSLALVTVLGTVAHAMLIDGTMETITKALLCAMALLATIAAVADQWARLNRAASR